VAERLLTLSQQMVPFEEIEVLLRRAMVSWRYQQGSSRGLSRGSTNCRQCQDLAWVHNTRWPSCTASAADGRRPTWRSWLLALSQHSASIMRCRRAAGSWRAGAATGDLARALRRAAWCMQASACSICRSPLWCRVRVNVDSCALPCGVHHAVGLE
jgi:hypothetical protein